ncbi:hypothetical protein Pla110_09470 [Polystyrenella longa]|uniref:Uncharacterized protein n=1 Tax=Polystyrenella longa TaxID=2528007 RepID=A0A518CJ41_9PLAN|nr:hypothetical protein [Polystyrenella longa]QDU79241.1 hypothetical protein Pla110_09470 [Polystyrenella longa]
MSRTAVIILSLAGLLFGIGFLFAPSMLTKEGLAPGGDYLLYGIGFTCILGGVAGLLPFEKAITTRLSGVIIFLGLLYFEMMILFGPENENAPGQSIPRTAIPLMIVQLGCLYMAITGKFGFDFGGSDRQQEEKKTVKKKPRDNSSSPSRQKSVRSTGEERGNTATGRKRPGTAKKRPRSEDV